MQLMSALARRSHQVRRGTLRRHAAAAGLQPGFLDTGENLRFFSDAYMEEISIWCGESLMTNWLVDRWISGGEHHLPGLARGFRLLVRARPPRLRRRGRLVV